jgi:hypothetical protein
MKYKIFIFLFFAILLNYGYIYSQETNSVHKYSEEIPSELDLLTTWPENGPELLLMIEDLGNGYSSPLVTENKSYITGEIDSIGYLFAFKLNGDLLWKKEYGGEWTLSYGGTRAMPSLVDDLLYLCSGLGKIICLKAESGEEVWSVDMIKNLGGELVSYGFAVPLLIHKNMLFCSPGGKMNNVVALNRFTGDLIWTSKGLGESPGYGSNILIKLEERNILVTFSEYSLLGIDAGNGDLLWFHKLADLGEIPCNTPIYEDGYIYFVAGPGNGATKLKLTANGKRIKKIWHNIDYNTYFGGFIKLGEYIYGSVNNKPEWQSLSAISGKVESRLKFHNGAASFADGKIYAYNQRGQVGLIKPNNGKLDLISSFRVQNGSKEHYAFPVIKNATLYIRHGNVLLAYNIKK